LINDLWGFSWSWFVKKKLRVYYLNVIPVSQLANINAGESSKIILTENILINRISFPGSQPNGSYTHDQPNLSTKLKNFTQDWSACEQILSEKIVREYFGYIPGTTEWAFGGFAAFQ
jgi:hypothetical protein